MYSNVPHFPFHDPYTKFNVVAVTLIADIANSQIYPFRSHELCGVAVTLVADRPSVSGEH